MAASTPPPSLERRVDADHTRPNPKRPRVSVGVGQNSKAPPVCAAPVNVNACRALHKPHASPPPSGIRLVNADASARHLYSRPSGDRGIHGVSARKHANYHPVIAIIIGEPHHCVAIHKPHATPIAHVHTVSALCPLPSNRRTE
jgi:hypothetical protein